MSDTEFNAWNSLLDLSKKTGERLKRYKTKYPILCDYYKSLEEMLVHLDQAHRVSGPKERVKTAGNLSELCYSVMTCLDNMDDEGFFFLYDEALWKILQTAMIQNELPINHRWTKSLIASNLLEFVINDTIKKLDPTKYDELNKDRKTLDKRFSELNSILVSQKLDKFKLNTVKFDRLKVIRNAVDHPDPDRLKEIEDKHVIETIEYTLEALNQLKKLHIELESKK